MKLYRVIDDSTCVLTTLNELEALRRFQKVMERHENTSDYGWLDITEIR